MGKLLPSVAPYTGAGAAKPGLPRVRSPGWGWRGVPGQDSGGAGMPADKQQPPPASPALQCSDFHGSLTLFSETRVGLVFFFAIYIFKGTGFLFQISTDSALWEDAGTHFANVTFFVCF